ncbi:MAG: Mbeg1-like protein [Lachnospirales bacterium]
MSEKDIKKYNFDDISKFIYVDDKQSKRTLSNALKDNYKESDSIKEFIKSEISEQKAVKNVIKTKLSNSNNDDDNKLTKRLLENFTESQSIMDFLKEEFSENNIVKDFLKDEISENKLVKKVKKEDYSKCRYLSDVLKEDLPLLDDSNPYDFLDSMVYATFSYIPFGKIDTPFYEGYYYEYYLKDKSINYILNELLFEHSELFEKRFNKDMGAILSDYNQYYNIFSALKDNARFKDNKVIDYKVIFDESKYKTVIPCQFAGFLVELKENEEYVVAYRGTDVTYEGWLEDIIMFFEDTKAQKESLKFLQDSMDKYPKAKFHITGHSKGGNCAFYSVLTIPEKYIERIDLTIYDSPLVREELAKECKDRMIRLRDEKRLNFVNIEHSMIGNVYFGHEDCKNDENTHYIKSSYNVKPREHNLYAMTFTDDKPCFCDEGYMSVAYRKAFATLKDTPKDEVEKACLCIFKMIGTSTSHSIFNTNVKRSEKLKGVINNFLAEDSENIVVASKFFGNIYDVYKESISEDLENEHRNEREVFKRVYSYFRFENVEEVDKFKDNLKSFKNIFFIPTLDEI